VALNLNGFLLGRLITIVQTWKKIENREQKMLLKGVESEENDMLQL
jgi:hypothetical protein